MSIELKENNESSLTFATDPTLRLIGLAASALALSSLLYWSLFISPIYSSLDCEKTKMGQIDCLLVERKAISLESDKTKIKNVSDIDGIFRGLFNNKQMVIKANPEISRFSLLEGKKKYYYPSTANTLIFSNLRSGTEIFQQRIQLRKFLRGKTDSDRIKVNLSLGWLPFVLLLSSHLLIIGGLLNIGLQKIYYFDGENKTLIILVKRIILDDVVKSYSFDRIEQVRFDRDDSGNIPVGTIVLKFSSDYDYSMADFADLEEGEENFKMINYFINKHK